MHQQGQLAQAKAIYERILAAQPQHFDALHLLGVIAYQAKNPALAVDLIGKAIQINPNVAAAYSNRGVSLKELKRLEEALASYDQAIALKPDDADAFYNRGLALQDLKRLEEALASYDRAIALKPDHAEAFSNRGNALQELQRLEEALASYDRAIALKPDYAEVFSNRGLVLQELKRLEEALASYDRAIALKADYAEAFSNRGLALQELQRLEEALASYDRAVTLKPDYAEAFSNRGNALQELKRLEEALASYDRAIALKPDYAEAFYNRGLALQEFKRREEALANYDRAVALKPDYTEAFNNRGLVLQELKRLEEALASYDRAIALKPDCAEAFNNRGNALKDVGRLTAAEASYREALRLHPEYAKAHSNLLFSLNYVDSLPIDATLEEAKRYGARVSANAQPKFTSWLLAPHPAKLRIGLVSGDLRNHPVGYFVEGLIRHLDKDQFEILAFPTMDEFDDLTERVRPSFHAWTPLYGKSDQDAASVIHQAGIHVLVDLSGHTAHNRLPVFSYKPAPVQVSWLGYFATTGLPEMDYFFGDPIMLPANEQHHFTEQVWKLAETWLCLTPPGAPVPIKALPALTNDYLTFGCFGNLPKMNKEVVKTWSEVLHRLPNSRLLLKTKQLADPKVAAEVQRRFVNQGVSPERLILEVDSPRNTYFEAYNRIDMVLDTFPYPGGTTSVDALWMGVPVLTLRGDRFLSHLGESIATNAGLTRWIAQDRNDYVNKAISFASDVQGLANIRQTLREKVLATPLFDIQRFAENFGNALWGLWRDGFTIGEPRDNN